MSKIDNSGQAFPSHPILYSSADAHQAQGMSLRDWFAGQALAGELAAEDMGEGAVLLRTKENAELMAARAYHMADAMLSARSNREEEDNG